MAELKKMYELTCLLDELNAAQEADNDSVGLADGEDWMLMESDKDLLDKFVKKTNLTETKSKKIYESAKRYGFIDDKKPPYDTFEKKAFVTPDGQTLIFKRWLFPTGLMRAVLEENKHLVSVIGLVSAIIVTIATVINLIILAKNG